MGATRRATAYRATAFHTTTASPAPTSTAVAPAQTGSTPAAAATDRPTTVAPTTVAPTTVPGPVQLAAANAGQLAQSVPTKAVPANLRPSLRGARSDLPAIYHDGCHLDAAVTKPGPCVFGDPASPTTVVLFGDSHAAQWFPAFDAVATRAALAPPGADEEGVPDRRHLGVQPDGEPRADRVRGVAGQRGRPGSRPSGPRWS